MIRICDGLLRCFIENDDENASVKAETVETAAATAEMRANDERLAAAVLTALCILAVNVGDDNGASAIDSDDVDVTNNGASNAPDY